jgi:peptidoglycan-N-acetylglucosamine deacetylase
MTSRPHGSRSARVLLYALALASGAGTAVLRAGATASAPMTATVEVADAPHAPTVASPAAAVRAEAASPIDDGIARQLAYRDGLTVDGRTPHRLILFTFDDGPDRRTTPLLLDRLDAVGIKAVFFLTASRIAGRSVMEREQAALAREIIARGHLVGSHTVDHLQLPLLDDTAAAAQVIGAEDIFNRVLGFRPTLFRPPFGARSPRIDALLASRGYTNVLWNLGAGDFQVHSAQEVYDTFLKVLERREREDGDRGGILLLHDTYSWSVDAFQMILGELHARNCTLLSRGEELYDVVSDLSFFYQPRQNAPVGFIAEPAVIDPAVLEQRQAKLRVETAQRCTATDGF